MKGFLLDTNCISELVSPSPERRVLNWMESVDEDLFYLSVLTMGEIRKGINGLAPGKRKARLERWLEFDLMSRFEGRVISIDAGMVLRWGALAAEARRRGSPLSVIDGLLAATALELNLTIVSRNVRDFAVTAVPVLNPWK